MSNREGRKNSFVFAFAGFFTVLAIGAWWVGRALAQAEPVGADAVATVAGGPSAIKVYGCQDGTLGYSTDGGICNIGDAALRGDMNTNNHAMWTQNLYRLSGNRFEQIGMSWVKHDDWTANSPSCNISCGAAVPCDTSQTACPELYTGPFLCAGCGDIYHCENGWQSSLGPRSQVNAANGVGVWPLPPELSCNETSVIDCQLQVRKTDLDPVLNPNAQYFLEQQVITPDETLPATATRYNNASYKAAYVGNCEPNLCCYTPPCTESQRVCGVDRSCTGTCTCVYPLALAGPAQCQTDADCDDGDPCTTDTCTNQVCQHSDTCFCQQPAISAWKGIDPSVVESAPIDVLNDGRFILAAKATSIGCDWYRYEYALYNMNSDRSAGSFRVPLPTDTGFQIQNIGFHGIKYHSGELYDPRDWTWTVASGSITWAPQSYTPTANANALRWGTLYNFRFVTNRAPDCALTVTIDLFKPGTPANVTGVSLAARGKTRLRHRWPLLRGEADQGA